MADAEVLTPGDAPAPVTTPAPAPQPAGNTVIDEVAAPAAAPPVGDDWRMQAAGGDAAFAERLGRYKSLADWGKSHRELEKKLSSGEHKKAAPPPGADAKPEEVAEWRKANGIPDAPTGYKIALPDGFVMGEADKPAVEDFTAFAHGKNWTPEKVNESMEWFARWQTAQSIALAKKDDEFRNAAIGELTADWGPADFYRNKQAITNYLDTIPEGLGRTMLQARDGEGRALGANPVFMRWLADQAFNMNPYGAHVPPGTENAAKSVEDRIAVIRKRMKEDMPGYRRDAAMQKEFMELLKSRERDQQLKSARG